MDEKKTLPADRENLESGSLADGFSGTGAVSDLAGDPLYSELLSHYQHGRWAKCNQIINTLLAKYPDNQRLHEFKADIDMQIMLHKVGSKDISDHVKSGVKPFFIILSAVLVVIALAGVLLFQMATSYVRNLETSRSQAAQSQKDNLQSLESQARAALSAGHPDSVLDILVRMEAIDPKYAVIADLRRQADDLLLLAKMYDQAMEDMAAKNYPAARTAFSQILEKSPSFRDVHYQISLIDQIEHVNTVLTQAQKSYEQGAWLNAISSFEEAISLDSSVQTPEVKDELLYSYLKSIVETLGQPDPTIPELERSGEFYQKALSLIPQNRNYLAARENLQQLSLELLISKYFQIAKSILRQPNQSGQAVDQAVDFLNRSLLLRPDNPQVKAELDKALLYQKAFTDFNLANWEAAIKDLNNLIKFDQNYPNGMGQVLLYESYSLLGQKFFSRGFYMDARTNFEQAEIIAWGQTENKLRLFQVQISLGYTLGKLENYKDAVSYFAFALKTSNALSVLSQDAEFVAAIQKGQDLNNQGKYQDAYNSYVDGLKRIDKLYTYHKVNVVTGDSLVFIADTNASTIEAIRLYNNVDYPVSNRALTLSVPSLP